jgi:hypothetical protein
MRGSRLAFLRMPHNDTMAAEPMPFAPFTGDRQVAVVGLCCCGFGGNSLHGFALSSH